MRQERKSAFLAKTKCDTEQALRAEESPSKIGEVTQYIFVGFPACTEAENTRKLKKKNAKFP